MILKMNTNLERILQSKSLFKCFHYPINFNSLISGRFGKVYECKQVSTNCKMAAKIIQCITQEARENARQEVRILSIIDHPRLLHFEAAFERRKDLIIITEL